MWASNFTITELDSKCFDTNLTKYLNLSLHVAKEISELYQLLSTGVLLEWKINNRGLFINARDLAAVNYFRHKLVHVSLLSISKIFLHHIYLAISVDLHNL